MKNTLSYKGFLGSVSYSDEDQVLFGKIEGIYETIMYEGTSVTEIKEMFKEAVNEYIESCKHFKKPLLKSFKGSLLYEPNCINSYNFTHYRSAKCV